jgi:hypothetical protein
MKPGGKTTNGLAAPGVMRPPRPKMGALPSRHKALSLSSAGSSFWVQTYAALSNSGAGPSPSRHKALRHEGKHLPLWKKAPTH